MRDRARFEWSSAIPWTISPFLRTGAYDAFDEPVLDATPLPSDFERYCNLGDDRQVHTVFVRGKAVFAGAGTNAGASLGPLPP